MRMTGVQRILAIVFMLVIIWLFASSYFSCSPVKSFNLRSWLGIANKATLQYKCSNKKPCPNNTFNFRITSGTANGVGPSICFDNTILMSSVKNNTGRGLNIVLINGVNWYKKGKTIYSGTSGISGQPQKMEVFNMYSGDIKHLLDFLKRIERGTLVLIASYDDPATRLNNEARGMLTELGSRYAAILGFRDNWIFLGGKGLKSKSISEKYVTNNRKTNKYDGWPEVLEMEGCFTRSFWPWECE